MPLYGPKTLDNTTLKEFDRSFLPGSYCLFDGNKPFGRKRADFHLPFAGGGILSTTRKIVKKDFLQREVRFKFEAVPLRISSLLSVSVV